MPRMYATKDSPGIDGSVRVFLGLKCDGCGLEESRPAKLAFWLKAGHINLETRETLEGYYCPDCRG